MIWWCTKRLERSATSEMSRAKSCSLPYLVGTIEHGHRNQTLKRASSFTADAGKPQADLAVCCHSDAEQTCHDTSGRCIPMQSGYGKFDYRSEPKHRHLCHNHLTQSEHIRVLASRSLQLGLPLWHFRLVTRPALIVL